jgi:hypothetical protein
VREAPEFTVTVLLPVALPAVLVTRRLPCKMVVGPV